ncbi:single-stranded-DNA-specific exonuclease RecJ [Listeria floridensis]|uniref:single-stranded-DNA-specific exonuclease RecJ n=1 Tax=Listeria floridensis TaxID=1494962 RepID=UPI0004B7C209|nr:single-stranded-DNA-specific exonuclease RecJ [Listeria floridensis]
MIHSKYTWKIEDIAEEKAREAAAEFQVSLPLAKMLLKRKITTTGQFDKFFHPDKYQPYDPFLLHDMDKAVERIKTAIAADEKIMIYGDYDADGVTSIAVLYNTLEKLGAKAEFYIPNRFSEGYGPNKEAFQMIKNQGYDLLITVDNGIAALDVMEFAKEIDLDVIVTDHHEKRETLPEAIAVIHPKHPESLYPFQDLAGVGVSYKLSHALLGEEPSELLDLVAVGTVADLVSLTDENRLFVQKGLDVLKESPNLGLQFLAKKAGAKLHEASEETIGFMLAPRLNAVGRLGAADPACELLLAHDDEEADDLAGIIEEANKERRLLVSEITEQATAVVEAESELPGMIIAAQSGWNAGVLGIVASRLVEKFGRPVICLAIDEATGMAKGSGRSVSAFHLYQELDQNRELLEAFGGHPMAAGLTVSLENLPLLKERMIKQAESLSLADLRPSLDIEAKLEPGEADIAFIQMIERMAPFGMDNPKPIFEFEQVHLTGTKQIGADKTHLKTSLQKGEAALDAVGFNIGHLVYELSPAAEVDAVGELSVNEWNNIRKPQLRLIDVSVPHWQLFDVRNRTEWNEVVREPKRDRIFVYFKDDEADALVKSGHAVTKFEELLNADSKNASELVFVDLPHEISQVEQVVRKLNPEKIFFHFGVKESSRMERIPDRAAFANLYALIKKFQPFSVERYRGAMAQKFGWNQEVVDFMSGVFFELDFVKIEDDVIWLAENTEKKKLEDAESYKRKEREIETQQKLLYASYGELLQWMERIMEQ